MATNKFNSNLISLFNLFGSVEELVKFLSKKNAFSEDFIKNITDSDYLKKIKSIDNIDISEIKNNINYEIDFKNQKISVDITKNDIFSYYDTDEELINKMRYYIKTEDYEKAIVLKNYLKMIEIDYK